MRCIRIAAIALAIGALAGCTPAENAEDTDLSNVEVVGYEKVPETRTDELPVLPPDENEYNVKFFSPDEAGTAPTVELRPIVTLDDRPRRVPLARRNEVTIVVFADMYFKNSAYALRKVNELVKKYDNVYPVNAVGIIMPTGRRANPANWKTQRKIIYPFYHDDTDMTALKRMAKAAGIEAPENFPATFIVDRHGRIRYYRHGFGYQATSYEDRVGAPETGTTIEENVPREYTLENGLRLVLGD
jgi:hypothetical protein